jgi:hypothetical protein
MRMREEPWIAGSDDFDDWTGLVAFVDQASLYDNAIAAGKHDAVDKADIWTDICEEFEGFGVRASRYVCNFDVLAACYELYLKLCCDT